MTSVDESRSVDFVPQGNMTFARSCCLLRTARWMVCCLLAGMVLVGSAAALDVGARMPEIGLKDLHGNPIDRASLQGKVVIVDFWASWCAPCKEEMPVLSRLHAKHAQRGLVVVGVSVDEEVTNVQGFLAKVKASFPIVHDRTHVVAERFAPPKMPSSYVIDRRGVVRYVHGGFRPADAEALAREVETLLAEASAPK